MDIREFQYDLPHHLIAQHPSRQRDHAKLMILDRRTGRISHRRFFDIVAELKPGDTVVVNDTRVIKARLVGRKETGGKVEVILTGRLDSVGPDGETWRCLVKSSKPLVAGSLVHFHPDLTAEVLEATGGTSVMRFSSPRAFDQVLDETGRMPLPPYIKRRNGPDLDEDRERYQTVYAEKNGAIAAPTAGLHFTLSLISEVKKAGASFVPLTLHIGIGTFLPVRTARIEDHRMHKELFHIPSHTADTINSTKKAGGRVIAVGTSTTRALETAVDAHGRVISACGETDLYIYPPFRFRVVDVLVTNFHLPGSTLIMLVSAFATREMILRAYGEAIQRGYRFFSYGDAMMIV